MTTKIIIVNIDANGNDFYLRRKTDEHILDSPRMRKFCEDAISTAMPSFIFAVLKYINVRRIAQVINSVVG